ncbi:RagB/SusD family nutrient uptake outer membrane protein [Pontibacter litorisediminis]|uniref:RagB/SusD family nutrient uptake outer membrane protein n=1 Tax=Pontibacter litorisediminis TaxID=1846260 RepID=UPI0023ED9120|nr:RagB/SusD family nutrient uptake outer membrane protein [Pontibacter litorisediminis]
MKKNLYIIGAAALTLTLSSCEKDFLDVKPSGNEISPEQLAEAAEKDPSLLNGNIAGLYSTMYNTGTGGTDLNHDDFGQKSWDMYMDFISSDMVLAGATYGWYEGVVRYQDTKDYTQTEGYMPWRYYYRIIFGANTVIDALGGTDAEQTEPLQRHIMGQAKAMRAYAYFYLAQLYSKGYGTGSEKILPIYTNTQVPNQPKATSEEVYNLIVDDLTQSIEYLSDFNRTSKDQIDQTVAKGLLAYTLAARGTQADLQQVVTLTDELIASKYRITNKGELFAQINPTTGVLTNPQSGFNNVATPSWMWGVDLTLANGLDLVSWWGQMDVFTYSYAWAGDPKTIDINLYKAIRANDYRKNWFDPEGGGLEAAYAEDGYEEGDFDLMPLNKFFDPNRVIGGQRNVTTDYVYMRVEEMVLLNAEAHARLGQDAQAKDALKLLMQERFDAEAYAEYETYLNGLGGQSLKDEILLQTRIELWGEGKTYLAIKRNKVNVTRGENHIFLPGQTFAWDSDELTFEIPQAEVLNNPVLNQ